jgi:long-chain acyl-CoA synthetase
VAEQPELHWHPEDIDWHHYFLKIHIPGLERHVYPELDAKLKKDKAPLRRHDHIAAFLDDIAERHELAPALLLAHEDGFSRRSYQELRGRALAVAIRLHAAGVRKGDRVLLSGQNHPDWLTVWFGVLRLGAVVVPIDPGLKPDAVRGIRRSCEPVGAIVDQKARDAFADALHGLDSWDTHEIAAPGAMGHLPAIELSSEDLASLLYTSGTTGDPKGVMLSHGNFTSMLGSLGRLFPLEPDDRVLCVLPMHHGFELMGGQLLPLSMGARVHYLDEVNADRLAWGLREGRITCMVGVPALWQLLERRIRSQVKEKGQLFELAFDAMLDANRSMGKALGLDVGPLLFGTIHSRFGGNIRMLISGGSALPAETQKLFIGLGLPMSEGYGMTEASPVLTVALPSPGAKVGHVGKPVPGVQLRIHLPDDKGVGEVWARGPNVMQGYFGNAAATEAVLDAEGWLHTGDLGKLDHQGRLTILGRAKDVVVSASGENIYLDDVEKALGRLRGVKELSLVGVVDPRGGERLGLLAVADLGEGKDRNAVHDEAQASLKAALAELPAFQRPAVIHIVDAELPRNASRKVLRKKVREVLEKIAAAAPERKRGEGLLGPVARAVAAVAGVPEERVGMGSRLAQDFGFDSLMWVELASALEGAGEGRPDPQSLSACETVADVVRLVGAPAPVHAVDEEEEGEEIVLPEWLTEPIKEAFGLVQDRFNGQALGTRVVGRAFIPRNRSCIVVSNHTSHLDMGLVKHALGPYGERMRALAAQDYFFEGNRWKVAWFRNFTNIAPLDRNAGFRASYRQARDIIEQGEVVLIFPEATRQTSGRMAEFKPLVGKLSLDTGTDILPMYIEGAYEAMPKGASFPRKRGIKIRIGPPLEVSELRRLTAGMSTAESARAATRLTQRAVEALRDGGVLDLKRMAAEKAREEASRKVETLEETVDRVMRGLPARLSRPLVEGETTWYWTLHEGPRYTLQVTAEGCTVSPGKPAGSADCVVKTSSDIFLKITTQSYVPDPEEFISGAIKTSDIPLLIEFSRIFQLSDTSGVAL